MAGHASRRWGRTFGSAKKTRGRQPFIAAVHRRVAPAPLKPHRLGVRDGCIVFKASFAIPRQGTLRRSTRLVRMTDIGTRLCLLVAGAALLAGPAFAQAPKPTAPLDSVPRESPPGAEPTAPAQDLSKKLNESNGIIHPKEVDPAIEKGAPIVRDP